MNAVESWALLAGICLVILAIVYVLGLALDWIEMRHHEKSDLDEIFRQDKAREVMRKWHDEQDK